jgi:5'-nucleotidase (lipoprotein e(P4) family)
MARILFLVALLLGLCGCNHIATRSQPPVSATTGQSTETVQITVPADDNLNATLWFQTSAERDQAYRQLYRAAAAQLEMALADPGWDAMPRGERSNDPRRLSKLAIILDIDETVLDNSPYQARLIESGAEYTSESWNSWVQQPLDGEKPGAQALPGAVAFVRAATARGIDVFYISNRAATSTDATIKALRAADFPAEPWQFLGKKGMPIEGCTQQDDNDKRCRRWFVARDHRVVMLFGDQLSDFLSEDGDPAKRRRLAEAYADWFGQRWWLLPNPMYGAWEAAAWSGTKPAPSRERKRELKRASLSTAH